MDPAKPHPARPTRSGHPLLLGYSWVVVAATFFLVIAGGQVTSTDSGDAIPTWPLPLQLELGDGRFAFELGHRQVALAVGLLTFGLLAGVVFRRRSLPRAAFRAATVAAVLVLVQAGLGGLRVLVGADHGDESPVVAGIGVTHAVLGQVLFCVVAAVSYSIFRARADASAAPAREPTAAPSLRSATRRAVVFLFLQLILGALLRLIRPGPDPFLLLLHLLGAVLVAFGICDVIFRVLRDPGAAPIRRPVQLAVVLLVAQFVLGMVAFVAVNTAAPALPELNWRTVVPTAHQGIGALLLVTSVLVHLHAGALTSHAAPGRAPEPAEVTA